MRTYTSDKKYGHRLANTGYIYLAQIGETIYQRSRCLLFLYNQESAKRLNFSEKILNLEKTLNTWQRRNLALQTEHLGHLN